MQFYWLFLPLVVPTVIRSLSSSQLLGKYVDPKAMSSNDLPSKEQLHLLSPKSKAVQIPESRKQSPSLPAKFIHTGKMPFKGEQVCWLQYLYVYSLLCGVL